MTKHIPLKAGGGFAVRLSPTPNKPKRGRPSAEQRFMSRIDKSGPGQCWRWTGNIDTGSLGYGRFWNAGEKLYAHRFAFALWCGPLLPGMVVRHTCDNPRCCNPDHLVQCTHAENAADMVAKNRQGLRLNRAKALEVDAKLRAGASHVALAAAYGVSEHSIRDLATGVTWAKVTGRSTPRERVLAKAKAKARTARSTETRASA